MRNYKGTKVPKHIIRNWQHNFKPNIVDKKTYRVIFNILSLGTGGQEVIWMFKCKLGDNYYGIVSFRNLEELERLEVTERILNEFK
jgi:hypothetical protein